MRAFGWWSSLAVAVAGFVVVTQAQFGWGGGEEIKLVKEFDKNGDKRLDAQERKAARAAAVNRGGGGAGGGFGFFRGGGGGATPSPGPKVAPADARTWPASVHLYDLTAVRTLFLEFESADWERELEDFHGTDVEVPATLTVDGQTYRDVGVHFRGASSFMMVPSGGKRPLNLSIDFVHEKQRLAGFRTLNLLNANSDPTFLRGVLYTEIARQYLPTPRMNYVRVVINGESWGVYLNAEQFNSDFTRTHFGSSNGARWKVPGSPRGNGGLAYMESLDAYKALYEIKSKDTPKAWADLVQMTKVLNQTPPASLEAALKPMLDVDGALRFLAVEVALVNSDGYWSRASDYNIYQDDKGVFHVIPHDVNEGLGSGGGGGGFGGFGGGGGPTLDPLVAINDPSKPLRSKLLAVPALRERYLGYVRDIANRHLDWAVMGPKAQQYQALIADYVKADTRKLYPTSGFTSGVGDLQRFVTDRRAFLLRR
jgi:hypothetical protein